MKTELLNPCDAPKCKEPAMYRVLLESGRMVVEVCGRHLPWGKDRGREVENS